MTDIYLLLLCLISLCLAFSVCIFLRAQGIETTYVRDFLHIATVTWIFSWPYWQSKFYPIIFVLTVFLLIYFTPTLFKKLGYLHRLRSSVSNKDEKWSGVSLYVFSYFVMTTIAFYTQFFPSACALATLSIGDGVGGLVGRKYGKKAYCFPWAKKKSYIGSMAVVIGSLIAIQIMAWWFNHQVGLAHMVIAAIAAGIIESISPKTSDNITIPIIVYLILI